MIVNNISTKKVLNSYLIRQATMSFATGANGRFSLGYTPKALDHKLWKNGLEVSLYTHF